jgi:hypothetical protein
MYRKGQKTITNVYEEVRAAPPLTVTPACNLLHHSGFRPLRRVETLSTCQSALCTNTGGAAVQEPQRPVGGVHLLPARLHAPLAAGPILPCTTAACRKCASTSVSTPSLTSLLADNLILALQGAKRPMGRGKPYGRMGAISAGGYPPKRKTRRGEDPDYAGRLRQPDAVMISCAPLNSGPFWMVPVPCLQGGVDHRQLLLVCFVNVPMDMDCQMPAGFQSC